MFRYLVAHVPTFRLDRCGWSPSQHAVLVAEQKNALRVQAATPVARRQGIRPGMSVAAARARVPEIEVEVLDPEGEATDLTALTTQLLRVSPNIAALPPDTLVAEISALPEVRGGQERALIERVRIRLQHLGHTANVVTADDPTTAQAVAIWRERCEVIPPSQGPAALASLPLAALALPSREHELLSGLGLSTIGAFAALSPAAVAGRLGPLGVAAHALARGRGPTPHFTPWDETGTLSFTQTFPTEVAEVSALLFVLHALLRDAASHLAITARGATHIEVHLDLDDGNRQSLALRLGAPTRDAARMLTQLRERLDRLQLTRPATALTITFPGAVSFDGKQLDLRDPRRTAEALDDVTARLQDTLGGRSVLAARAVPRHRPEAAWRPVPFALSSVPTGPVAAAQVQVAHHGPDPVACWQGNPHPSAADRPPILLFPPMAVEIAPPLRAVRVHGRWHDIVHHSGPEQVGGEWWRQSFQRSYWRATLDDGRVAWLYQEDKQWAVHGWWDR